MLNVLVNNKVYYDSSVWANTSKKNIDNFKVLKNFAARICTGTTKCDHMSPVLQQLNQLPVSYLYIMLRFRDTITTFKCLKGFAPLYLTNRFVFRSQLHVRNTRRKDTLGFKLYRNAAGQHSLLGYGTSYRTALNTLRIQKVLGVLLRARAQKSVRACKVLILLITLNILVFYICIYIQIFLYL